MPSVYQVFVASESQNLEPPPQNTYYPEISSNTYGLLSGIALMPVSRVSPSVSHYRAYYDQTQGEQEYGTIGHTQYLIWSVVREYDRAYYVHGSLHEVSGYHLFSEDEGARGNLLRGKEVGIDSWEILYGK